MNALPSRKPPKNLRKPGTLTGRQERFAREYVRCGNASEAYRRAYPKSRAWRNDFARKRAWELLQRGDIQGTVAELRAQAEDEALMDLEEACRRLTAMGRGCIQDCLDEGGHIDPRRVAEAGGAVLEYVETATKNGVSRRVKVDPRKAIMSLADLRGWRKSGSAGVQDDPSSRTQELAALFRTMTMEERHEWLRRDFGIALE
ncbi:MAG: terminase small subunit [Lentisphaeria bacterium]|nr:terminase small subunit [Lentisphaeria bacterium]